MKYITVTSYEEMSEKAADRIAAQILMKPNCVLGLATGSTPIGTYQRLIDDYQCGKLDFSQVTSVNLDEYVGLDGSNEQSYRFFMDTRLFDHVNIRRERTFVPNGMASDPVAEGTAYDRLIGELGGIDLQLLGIGLDGHIGFNEPAPHFVGPTHPVELDESTIRANARFFDSEEAVPRRAITMGMTAILQARRVLLLANGAAKKPILEQAIFGPIDPRVPASLLQVHPHVAVIFSEN